MKKMHRGLLALVVTAGVANTTFGAADVALCEIPSIIRWGAIGDITAYSLATTSVNIGDVNLNWIQNGTNHPVISQNMFRYISPANNPDGYGKFEQLGQSYLKHSFCALQIDSQCAEVYISPPIECTNPGGCLSMLTPGCEDPYSSSRNGSQSLLGPKWQVNPTTGQFSWPYAQQGAGGNTIFKRLQVHTTELQEALDQDALLVSEGIYVTRDDALAGTNRNNVSYRVFVIDSVIDSTISFPESDQVGFRKAALERWIDEEAGVKVGSESTDEAGPAPFPPSGQWTGTLKIGHQATDLGGGMWHYEYAVYNLNSHRGIRSFSIPLPPGVTVSNVGFHDVDYHSGDGEGAVTRSGADWTPTVAADSVTWATETFAENPNANALLWATLYNFRFDANTPPISGGVTATMDYFRPGDPGDDAFVTSNGVVGPSAGEVSCPADLDDSGTIDAADLALMLGAWGTPDGDLTGDDTTDASDLAILLGSWGPC